MNNGFKKGIRIYFGEKHGMYSHGMSGKRIYEIYCGIKKRCNDVLNKNYGGRGIKCEWNNFEEFRDDMYESYLKHCEEFGEKQTTIDRIDNNGNYCKDNCRWATYKEQCNNTRKVLKAKRILFNGKELTINEWAKELGISRNTIYSRIKYKWPINEILNPNILPNDRSRKNICFI